MSKINKFFSYDCIPTLTCIIPGVMTDHLLSRLRILVHSCVLTLFLATKFHAFHIEEIIGLENDLLREGANCFRITAFEFKISRTISAASATYAYSQTLLLFLRLIFLST